MRKLRFFYKYSLVAALCWVLLVLVAASVKLKTEEQQINEIIKNEAMSTLDKDKALAFWLMQHNGMSNGSQGALSDFVEIIGAQTQIIGYKKFDALKNSDPWLANTVSQMQNDKKERYEIMETGAQYYSRLAAPMRANSRCGSCHEGVKAGDMIGVMTISMPMKSYTKMRENVFDLVVISHAVALLLGLVFIYVIFAITRRYVKSVEAQKEREIKDYEDTLDLMVGLMEERDAYTAGHAERVAQYCVLIGKRMGLSHERLEILREASRLHDIGKVAVPDTVLLKPGKLNDSEYLAIQAHVTEGYNIISKIQKYKHLAEIIRYHHEKFDGTGYPYRKKGDEISLESSIMAAADSFDAMTTNRIYKPRKSVAEAIEEIERCKGTQFHPDVANAAIKALCDVVIPEHTSQLDDNINQEHKLDFFFKDSLTGLYNLEYLKMITQNGVNDLDGYEHTTIISLKNFSRLNNEQGWEAGDRVIKSVANFITANFAGCIGFRIYGDIFIVACKQENDICSSDITSALPQESKGFMEIIVSCKKGCNLNECDYSNIKKLERS